MNDRAFGLVYGVVFAIAQTAWIGWFAIRTYWGRGSRPELYFRFLRPVAGPGILVQDFMTAWGADRAIARGCYLVFGIACYGYWKVLCASDNDDDWRPPRRRRTALWPVWSHG